VLATAKYLLEGTLPRGCATFGSSLADDQIEDSA
jgi:hypothetical protein